MPDINYKNNLHDDLTELINKFVDGLSEVDFEVLRQHIRHDSYGFKHANSDMRLATNKRIERYQMLRDLKKED